jgi:transcriptional regulator GlxA family with amidase domain
MNMIDSQASSPDAIALDGTAEDVRAPRAQDVLFLLLRDFMLLDLARLMEAFHCANAELPGSYRFRFATPGDSVPVTSGLSMSGCESLPETLPRETILVVPGVFAEGCRCDPRDPSVRRVIDWLHGAGRARPLVCVSSGAVLAAHAGLLSHRECTTDTANVAHLRRAEPSARVLDDRSVVEDGPVITSAGVSDGVDVALRLIGRQLGSGAAARVARRLIAGPLRASAPRVPPWMTRPGPLPPAVRRVQEAVAREPAARWSAADLAATACTSARHLSRLFREAAGCAPLQYVQQVRLRRAKEIMTRSRLDLKSVAAYAGFRSAQHLRRVWSRWESRPPSDFRTEQHRALRAGRPLPQRN